MKRRQVHVGVLCCLCIAVQGSACHDPIVGIPSGLRGFEILYSIPIAGGDIVGHKPATDSTRMFVAINHKMHAFDLETGALRWMMDSVGSPRRVATAGGRVFWSDNYGAVAVDAVTGALLWKFAADSPSSFSESDADNDAFYFGSSEHKVYAVRATDGQLLWMRDVGPDWEYGGIVRGVTVSGDTVYAVVEHGTGVASHIAQAEVFAFDRTSGEQLWNFTYGDGTRLTLSQNAARVSGRFLLLQVNRENTIVVLDRFTATEVWRSFNPGGWSGPIEPPEVADGVAYSGSHDQHAEAFELETGQRIWRTANPPGAGGIYRFAVCGSRLIMNDGSVTVFDRHTGTWIGRGFTENQDIPYTDFVVVDNTAYFVTGSNFVAMRCPT